MGKTDAPEVPWDLLLTEVARVWRAQLQQRLAPFGLTPPLWRVLALASTQSLGQTELAQRMGVQAPTLVDWLDRLEREAWLVRARDPLDRRNKFIRVDDTSERWRAVQASIDALRSETVNQWTADESAHLVFLLDRLRARLARA